MSHSLQTLQAKMLGWLKSSSTISRNICFARARTGWIPALFAVKLPKRNFRREKNSFAVAIIENRGSWG